MLGKEILDLDLDLSGWAGGIPDIVKLCDLRTLIITGL